MKSCLAPEGELLKSMGRGARTATATPTMSLTGGRGRGSSLLSNPSFNVQPSQPSPIISVGRGSSLSTPSVGGRGSTFSATTTAAPSIASGRGTSLISSATTQPPTSVGGRGSSFSSNTAGTRQPSSVKIIPKSNISSSDEDVSSDEEYLQSVSKTQKQALVSHDSDEDLSEDEMELNKKISSLKSKKIPESSKNQVKPSAFGQCLTSKLTNEQFVKSFFARSPERLSPYFEIFHTSKQPSTVLFNFDTPSPDDMVLSARQQQKTNHQPLENFQPIQKKQASTKNKPKNATILDMDLDDEKSPKSEPPSPKPVKGSGVKQKAPEDNEKKRINVVIIGHVDAGKSTLMGHLLYKLGNISDKLIHKFKKESVEIGKSSFHFAWVMDEHEEERQRGVTMDVGVRYFETEHRHVTILDAPGHKDFIPRMITGAAQADFAILVVDATPNGFETGFRSGGQTKEHLILTRSLGVEQVIVVINKLDTVGWSKERYDYIVNELSDFMKQIGYQTQDGNNVFYIPGSGLQGENLITKSSAIPWYDGLSVVEQIDKFEPKPRDIEKALRMSVSDVYKSLATGITVAGKIETGTLSEGDDLILMPIKEVCTVKTILRNKTPMKHVYAGDNVEIGLGGIDMQKLMVGQILCPVGDEIKVTDRFRARLVTFDIKIPLLKGSQVVLHLHNIDVPAVVTKLISSLNKQQEVIAKKPRCVPKHSNAIVEITTEYPICVEKYADFAKFGRLTIRVSGETVAAGVIEEVKRLSKKGLSSQTSSDE